LRFEPPPEEFADAFELPPALTPEVSVAFFAASDVLDGASIGCVGAGCRRSATGFLAPQPETIHAVIKQKITVNRVQFLPTFIRVRIVKARLDCTSRGSSIPRRSNKLLVFFFANISNGETNFGSENFLTRQPGS